MISLANDLAEKQLMEGTASAQVITHFLRLGSIKAQAELELLRMQKELTAAKTEAYKRDANVEMLYTKAVEAMRCYSGGETEIDDEILFGTDKTSFV